MVVKLGGSLFSTSDETLIDFDYLTNLKKLLLEITADGTQVAMIVGGGFLTRKFQKMLSEKITAQKEDLDWIGIATINLNAEMVRSFLHDISENDVLRYREYDRVSVLNFSKPLYVCAAKEPGHSSDTDAVYVAEKIGAKTVYRLTNIDAIYSEDPKQNPNAEKYKNLTWDEYFKIVKVDSFEPGAHYPIDPVASKKSKEMGLKFILMDGRNFDNAKKAFRGEEFDGTVVSDSV